MNKLKVEYLGFGIGLAILIVGFFGTVFNFLPMIPNTIFAAGTTQTASSTVIVGNAAPTVTSVVLNAASSIVLTANTTTNVSINATISDNNGCGDITSINASTTVLLYRSGITSSTCMASATPDAANCYVATAFTASSTCSSGTTNTTTTVAVQYFAQATDASSTFASQNWIGTVIFRDPSNATGSTDSAGVELLTLTAINVTTSSINYGTLSASSTSGASNQTATSTNAGNSTTTLQLSATATLTSGSNAIATSSQRFATSTFTFPGGATQLTASAVTVTGFLLTSPTSTSNVAKVTFWGLEVLAGTPTGTYTGVTLFTSLFQP
ncbi:MAG: hypothetical protein AAB652_01855 [Patescibacteria group bacterium]